MTARRVWAAAARAARRLLAAAACCAALAGCERSYRDMAQERALHAARAEGPVVIAVIEDEDPTRRDYVLGARLAVEQINAEGGVLGRPLVMQVYEGGATYDESLPSIRSIAANPQISAVVGHRKSSVAIPASVVYEDAQVLFLPGFATDPRLTLHGFQFVLRTLGDNQAIAAQSANVAALFGYESLAVLHSRDDYSRGLAFLFEDAARREGLTIAFRGSFFQSAANYRNLIGRMNQTPFDAVYLSTGAAAGARVMRQLREMGLRQPVISSDGLATSDFPDRAGPAGERLIAPIIYAPDDPSPVNRAFVRAYRALYGSAPNKDAAQGYDSMRLFAAIANQAGSVEPQVLAAKAHYIKPVSGVTGLYAYDENGEVYGKSYRFQILRGRRWRSLPGVEAPYLLAHFREELAEQAQHDATAEALASAASTDQASGPDAQAIPQSPNQDQEDPRLGRLARHRVWLSLAHAILEFETLGVLIPDDEEGAATANMARAVGGRLGFETDVCRLPAAADDADAALQAAARRQALRCHSRLSARVDAVFVSTETAADAAHLRRLNQGLRAYNIPSFTLVEELEEDFGLTMALVSAGVDLHDPAQAQRLDGVLKNMRVYDLGRRLDATPAVVVDLEAFADLEGPLDLNKLSVISRIFTFDAAP